MANAFAPDVGVDIGASNVRPYSPDPVDFSSLGKAFSGLFPEATQPTEKDKESVYLAPFAQDLNRISQIEDPTKRDVYLRAAYTNALATMPEYGSQIKSVYEQFRGVALPTGSPLSIGEAMISDYLKTSDGQTAVVVATSKATRPDGTFDEQLYSASLSESAFRYNQELAVNARLEREVQIGDRKAEVVWESEMLPGMIGKANNVFTQVTSSPVVQSVLKGQGDTVQVQTLIDGLKAERSRLEAEFSQIKARTGITDPSEKYSLKPAFAQFDSLITILETNSTTLQKAADTLVKDDAARFIVMAKDPLTRMAFNDQNAKSQLLMGTLQRDPQRLSQMQEMFLAPSFLTNVPAAPEADQGMAFARPTENLSIEDRVAILPEFSREAIATVSQQTTEWKKEQIKGGLFLLNAFTPDTIKTADQAIGTADTLGFAYLSLIDRPQSSYSKPKDIQEIFGTKAFATMEAVAKASPATGAALFKQAHKYGQDEINKQADSLAANFATIADLDMNPFEVVIENGQVVLKLNEEAVRSDPALKRAMVSAAGSVVGGPRGGAARPREETDPYKVMEAYMGIFNRGAGRYGEIVDHIKSLNILYQQMGRMPEDIRNSEFSGQVYLADRLSRLPGWRSVANQQGAQ